MSTAAALSSLPSLKIVEVSITQWPERLRNPTIPPLRDFKNLSSFSISCYDNGFLSAYPLRDEVAAVINASPSLASLSISTWAWSVHGGGFTPLQAFLETSRPELVRLELDHVPLPSEGIREILSDKLQQLSVTAPLGDPFDFDWGRLWGALQEAWIALSILKVSGMDDAMDEMSSYLLSYSGLKRLEIARLGMESQEEEDRASLVFWQEIIPHHRGSLTALSMGDGLDGGWCYGPRAAAALCQCSALRDLTVSVCRVDPSWAEATLSRARKYKQIEFHSLEPDGASENCGVRLAGNGAS
jgi:hypothetical protein